MATKSRGDRVELASGRPNLLDCRNAYGGDMASTPVTIPEVHAESVTYLVNQTLRQIVANDDNYAQGALAA